MLVSYVEQIILKCLCMKDKHPPSIARRIVNISVYFLTSKSFLTIDARHMLTLLLDCASVCFGHCRSIKVDRSSAVFFRNVMAFGKQASLCSLWLDNCGHWLVHRHAGDWAAAVGRKIIGASNVLVCSVCVVAFVQKEELTRTNTHKQLLNCSMFSCLTLLINCCLCLKKFTNNQRYSYKNCRYCYLHLKITNWFWTVNNESYPNALTLIFDIKKILRSG